MINYFHNIFSLEDALMDNKLEEVVDEINMDCIGVE
jgi:c-di-GMP-related signal transduction protein